MPRGWWSLQWVRTARDRFALELDLVDVVALATVITNDSVGQWQARILSKGGTLIEADPNWYATPEAAQRRALVRVRELLLADVERASAAAQGARAVKSKHRIKRAPPS